MTWLVQEIWLWMVLSALAGAVLTGFFSTTEVKVERWVPTPVPEEPELDEAEVSGRSQATAAPEPEVFPSPFPEFETTSGPRPWEEEELWTTPVRGDEWGDWTSESASAPAAELVDEPAELVDEPAELVDEPAELVDEPAAELVVESMSDDSDEEALEETVTAETEDPFPVVAGQVEAEPEPDRWDDMPELVSVDEGDVEAGVEVGAELTESEPVAVVEPVAELELVEDEDAPQDEDRVEGEAVVEDATPVAESAPVEELSAADKIKLELARLEAEMEKRAQRRRELEAEQAEAERAARELLERAADPVPDVVESTPPARKPRKKSTPKPSKVEATTEQVAVEPTPAEQTVEQVTAEQAEAERLEAERIAAERAARNKARAQRAAATRARKQAERLEAERAEQERVEAERAEAERAEAERLEAERAEAERAEQERLEAEKVRVKAERAAAAKARAKAKREEAARLKAEQEAAERAQQEAAEQEQARALQEAAEQVAAELVESEPAQADATTSAPAEPVVGPTWLDPDDDSDEWKKGPFGPGSAYAAFDGTAPRGYSVKANLATRLYHSRQSRFYSRTQADVWFESEEHAQAAGFIRWDQRGTMAHASLQEGEQQGPAA